MSRKSLQTPQNRKSLLGFGAVSTKLRKLPEQKKLTYSANRSLNRWSNQGTQPIKDTRKLTNKSYQKEMIDDVVGFLNESGYPHPVSAKSLSSPTTKGFVQVFEHLYGLINSEFKLEGKFEEEVPKILKSLGYPFTISKSAMYSITSLHSWPTLLGVLQWLVELARVINFTEVEQMIYPPSLSDDMNHQHDKIFFEYTSQCYRQFMSGTDDFTEEKKQLGELLLHQAQVSEEENINLNKEIEELEKELAILELDAEIYDDALKRKNELEEKMVQHEVKFKQLEQKMQVENQQMKHLQEQCKEEGMDVPPLGDPSRQEEIKHKSSEVKEQLDRLNSKKERLELQNNERELKYSKLYDKSIDCINEYNDLAQKLSRKDVFKKCIGNESIELNIHNLKDSTTMNETKERLKQLLNRTDNQIRESRYRLDTENITLQEQIDKQSELIVEKKNEQTQSRHQLENAKKDCETKKKNFTSRYEDQMMVLKSDQLRLDEENKQLTTLYIDTLESLKNEKEEFWRQRDEDKKIEKDYTKFLKEFSSTFQNQVKEDQVKFDELNRLLIEESEDIDLKLKQLEEH